MEFYLGLDIGGSRSRWAWLGVGLDLETAEQAVGIQVANRGAEEAARALDRLFAEIREAHPGRSPEMTVIGMAGAGDRAAADELEVALRDLGVSWPLRIVGDVVVAASSTLSEGPGIALWSGTGSFAVARDPDGRLHRVGGRGYLLGDSGSAYDIVRCAGVAAVRSLDGLGPKTGLLESLVRATSAPSPDRLGPVLQGWSTEQVAGCFPTVLRCAEAGDEVAVAVLRRGAHHLARLALAASSRSGLDPGTLQLHLGGGTLETGGLFGDLLGEELEGVGFEGRPTMVAGGAAQGGALLAKALHLRDEPLCSWVEAGGTS